MNSEPRVSSVQLSSLKQLSGNRSALAESVRSRTRSHVLGRLQREVEMIADRATRKRPECKKPTKVNSWASR
jgi:hypothetical protein